MFTSRFFIFFAKSIIAKTAETFIATDLVRSSSKRTVAAQWNTTFTDSVKILEWIASEVCGFYVFCLLINTKIVHSDVPINNLYFLKQCWIYLSHPKNSNSKMTHQSTKYSPVKHRRGKQGLQSLFSLNSFLWSDQQQQLQDVCASQELLYQHLESN